MNLLNICAIAVALAMDAFAVAIAAGVTLKKNQFSKKFSTCLAFRPFPSRNACAWLECGPLHPGLDRKL